MHLFKLIRKMHVKNESSDNFTGFKTVAIKSPNNCLQVFDRKLFLSSRYPVKMISFSLYQLLAAVCLIAKV